VPGHLCGRALEEEEEENKNNNKNKRHSERSEKVLQRSVRLLSGVTKRVDQLARQFMNEDYFFVLNVYPKSLPKMATLKTKLSICAYD
jgi:hypothetical protein